MTILVPMTADAYDRYLATAITSYAQDNIDAGRWPETGALERSRSDFMSLLPCGLSTPNHHLMEIQTTDSHESVGILWFFVEQSQGVPVAFVYDIEIDSKFRRQGHATDVINALQILTRTMNVSRIHLHVFAHNEGGLRLYRKLGFQTTGINMVKDLL